MLSGKEPRTSLLFFILITSTRSWLSSKEKSFDQFMTSYTCANELKTTGQLACHQLSDLLLHRYFTAHLIQITNYCMSQIFWIMVSWIIEFVNVKSMHYKGLLCCSVWWILHKSRLFVFSNNLYLTLPLTAHLWMHSKVSTSSKPLMRMLGTAVCRVSLLQSQRRISHLAIPRALQNLIS